MRPEQITCHSICVQESDGWFTEGIGLWAGHLHRQCQHWCPPAGGITGLGGLPNWIVSLLLQPRSDNQCKGVSERPWWMITPRSQRVPCGFNLFLTSDVGQSCQVTQIERYQLCQCKSSLNHKGIIFVRSNIIAPLFLPRLCLRTQHPATAQY